MPVQLAARMARLLVDNAVRALWISPPPGNVRVGRRKEKVVFHTYLYRTIIRPSYSSSPKDIPPSIETRNSQGSNFSHLACPAHVGNTPDITGSCRSRVPRWLPPAPGHILAYPWQRAPKRMTPSSTCPEMVFQATARPWHRPWQPLRQA